MPQEEGRLAAAEAQRMGRGPSLGELILGGSRQVVVFPSPLERILHSRSLGRTGSAHTPGGGNLVEVVHSQERSSGGKAVMSGGEGMVL